MDISLRMKVMQELKKLQAEVKTMQEEKQERQAQLEPFQQQAEGMIDELQIEKGRWEHVLAESREVLKENITTQGLETLEGKSAEAKEKATKLGKKFHVLELALQKVH
jgi:peptidoglycan hydrolase CwlO-like protein